MNIYWVKISKTAKRRIIPGPSLPISIKYTWKSILTKILFNPMQFSIYNVKQKHIDNNTFPPWMGGVWEIGKNPHFLQFIFETFPKILYLFILRFAKYTALKLGSQTTTRSSWLTAPSSGSPQWASLLTAPTGREGASWPWRIPTQSRPGDTFTKSGILFEILKV